MLKFSMPHAEHIRKSSEFKNALQKGKKKRIDKATLYFVKNDLAYSRLGCIIGKKVGSAPNRNKIRRLWKEAFRIERGFFKENYDIVLRCFPAYELQKLDKSQSILRSIVS